jgi:hypothetical protein
MRTYKTQELFFIKAVENNGLELGLWNEVQWFYIYSAIYVLSSLGDLLISLFFSFLIKIWEREKT